MFDLLSYEVFRNTPAVKFYDITVDGSNARDLVVHTGPATSPNDNLLTHSWQFYKHEYQEDNLLALHGGRTFYLVNLSWSTPFHVVRLEAGGAILRIPRNTYHRSVSDPDGSIVLNQAVRDPGFDIQSEFQTFNSIEISDLFAVTSVAAPKPQTHGPFFL